MKLFRSYHLALATIVLGAYLVAEELGLVHAWLGYFAGGLLALRLATGLARRRGFEFTRLIPRLSMPPVGQGGIRHPFIARTLTLALLLAVAGTAATGIAMDRGGTLVGKSIRTDDDRHDKDDDSERNDDAAMTSPSSLFGLAPPARADDGRDGGEDAEDGPLGEIHETLGNLLLPLAAAHLFYVLMFRFPLARFMLFVPARATRSGLPRRP